MTKEIFVRNAHVYRVLANPKRLEILNSIKEKELTVGELVERVGVCKANISQHLNVLRQSHLVCTRRDGRRIFYSLIDPDIVRSCQILKSLYERKVIK